MEEGFKNENIIGPSRVCLKKQPILETHVRPFISIVKENIVICSISDAMCVLVESRDLHPLVATADMCFRHHYPIILKPDDFLLPLMQSFTAERPVLKAGEEKIKIQVRMDDFMSADADYRPLVAEFSKRIKENITPEEASIFEPLPMSTTGGFQRMAYTVALMDMCQNKFSYSICSFCGIPKITLLGTQQDWVNLHLKVEQMLKQHPSPVHEWKVEVLSILKEIAATGAGNAELWKSFYKYEEGSGGPYISGWINYFFPTFRKYEGGIELYKTWEEMTFDRSFDAFPTGMCKAPATYTNYMTNETFQIALYAGHMGVGQKQTAEAGFALFPVWGFCIGAKKT